MQLPNDFECIDCTIRLLREAAEWSNNYKFWSCADVDIRSEQIVLLFYVFYFSSDFFYRFVDFGFTVWEKIGEAENVEKFTSDHYRLL